MRYLIIDKRPRIGEKEIPTASKRIVEELKKKNIENDFIFNDQLEFVFQDEKMEIFADSNPISDYSHILFRGHSLENEKEYHYKRYIIDFVDQYNKENPSKKIFVQNAEAIKRLPYYNKIAIAQFCIRNNIPYFNSYFRTDGDYLTRRKVFNNFPLIIKEYTGANRIEIKEGKEVIKKNVFKINNEDELRERDYRNFFIQEFSDTGEDYRVFVKLGKVIGGWKRIANDSFMTVSKGIYEMYNQPNREMKEMAEKVATILNADFIAVDFMYINNKLAVQEFSFHPGFKAYETKIEGTPVNIAEAIITAFR